MHCNPKDNNEEFNVLVLTRDEITGGMEFNDFEVDRIIDWLLDDLLENSVWTSLEIIREEVMRERHVQQR